MRYLYKATRNVNKEKLHLIVALIFCTKTSLSSFRSILTFFFKQLTESVFLFVEFKLSVGYHLRLKTKMLAKSTTMNKKSLTFLTA